MANWGPDFFMEIDLYTIKPHEKNSKHDLALIQPLRVDTSFLQNLKA